MKKLFAMILVFCMVPVFALACENVMMVRQESVSYIFSGATYWALTEDCHIAGMKTPAEAVPRLSVQSAAARCVRGFSENGVIRAHCAVKLICAEGTAVGLTKLTNVTVLVDPQFYGIVSSVVSRRIGEGTAVCAQSVIASTMWRMESYIAHIFFSSDTDRFVVGSITFNGGRDVALLYAGDFDGNGTLELGFAPGWFDCVPEPEPVNEPEPTVIVYHYCVTQQTTQNVCNRVTNNIIQDNRQININSVVTNNQRQIVNINTREGCGMRTHCLN